MIQASTSAGLLPCDSSLRISKMPLSPLRAHRGLSPYTASNQQVLVGRRGSNIQISTSQARAGSLHQKSCKFGFASLRVRQVPMASLFHNRLRRKAAAPSTSPSSGNSQAILPAMVATHFCNGRSIAEVGRHNRSM